MIRFKNRKVNKSDAETLFRMYEYTRLGLSPYMWDLEGSSNEDAEEIFRRHRSAPP